MYSIGFTKISSVHQKYLPIVMSGRLLIFVRIWSYVTTCSSLWVWSISYHHLCKLESEV